MTQLVECLTGDRRVASSRLTVLCLEVRYFALLSTGSIQEDRKSPHND